MTGQLSLKDLAAGLNIGSRAVLTERGEASGGDASQRKTPPTNGLDSPNFESSLQESKSSGLSEVRETLKSLPSPWDQSLAGAASGVNEAVRTSAEASTNGLDSDQQQAYDTCTRQPMATTDFPRHYHMHSAAAAAAAGLQSSSSDGEGADGESSVGLRRAPRTYQRGGYSSSSNHPIVMLRDKKTKKTEEQIVILLKYFNQDSKPPKSVHFQISQESGLTVEEVVNWFRNRRSRHPPRATQQSRLKNPMSPSASLTGIQPAWTQQLLNQSPFQYPSPQDSIRQQQGSPFQTPTSGSLNDVQSMSSKPTPMSVSDGPVSSGLDDEDPFACRVNTSDMPYPLFSPMDLVSKASEFNQQPDTGPMMTPISSFQQQNLQDSASNPASVPATPPPPHGGRTAVAAQQYQRQMSLAHDSFLALFQMFDENSLERQLMLSRLVEKLSIDEQDLVSREMQHANIRADPYRPMHERIMLAWNEMKRIFTAQPCNAARQSWKKSSKTSQDSGRGQSETEEVMNNAGTLNRHLVGMQVSDSSSCDDSSCDGSSTSGGGNLAVPHCKQEPPVGGVESDIVCGLASVLKEHPMYIVPIFRALESIGLPTQDMIEAFQLPTPASYVNRPPPAHTQQPAPQTPGARRVTNRVMSSPSMSSSSSSSVQSQLGMSSLEATVPSIGPEVMESLLKTIWK